MSPARIHGQENEKRLINGPRPTQLKIKTEQQQSIINGPRPPPLKTKKPSKKNHSFFHPMEEDHQHQHPIIIYAHSPKIIHTEPRDFMALVQKLTGLSSRPEQGIENEEEVPMNKTDDRDHGNGSLSSILTDENSSSSSHNYLADMPLFTPNSTNFFFSPLPMFRYADTSPNMGSLFEAKKELPQY